MRDDDGFALVEQGSDQGDGGADLSQRNGVDPDGTGDGARVAAEAFGEVAAVVGIAAGAASEVEEDGR